MQQYIGRDKCFVTFCECKRLFHATANQWCITAENSIHGLKTLPQVGAQLLTEAEG